MSKLRFYLAALASVIVLNGCNSLKAIDSVDALISSHTDESLQELTEIISQVLAAPITLSKTAFTYNNRLVIDRKLQQTIEHGVINGKQLERPPVFVLTLNGSECHVTEEKSQQSWRLTKAKCIAKVNN